MHESARTLRTGLVVAGLSGVVGGRAFVAPFYFPYPHSGVIGWLLTGLGAVALWVAVRQGTRHAIWIVGALVAGLHSLDTILMRFEAVYQPVLGLFSFFAHPFCALCGLDATVDGGSLLLAAEDGTLRIVPTVGLVGARGLVLVVVAGSYWTAFRVAGVGRTITRMACFSFLAFGLRYAAMVTSYGLGMGVLGDQEHVALVMFWNPWFELGCVAIVYALTFAGNASATYRFTFAFRPAVALLAIGVAGGAVWAWQPVGRPQEGRVLIDDRCSGIWEPAGRLLDRRRWGDFSTYSFASLTESLARRFSVTVNADREYTPDYLAEHDVLLFKTPNVALSPAECDAIKSWVERGGGLFLISDHTDLEGMSSHLNLLARDMGIEFQNDAIKGADGTPVVSWRQEPLIDGHAIGVGLDGFSFMTSCSLATRRGAAPIMVVRQCVAEGGDYSRRSNFGTVAANAAEAHGGVVVCAANEHGSGRVVAFIDSTVLSSFAYHRDNHDLFVLRAVAWLNCRSAGWLRAARSLLGWVYVLGFALWLIMRWRNPAVLAAAPIWFVGMAAGCTLQVWCSGSSLRVPPEMSGVQHMGIVADSPMVVLPPVLGSQPHVPPGVNLSTLVQVPQRLGVETKIVPRDASVLPNLQALMVLNPQDGGSVAWSNAVRAWVQEGGRLFVWSLAGAAAEAAHASYAGNLPAPTEVQEARERGLLVRRHRAGAGSVVEVFGTEYLDAADGLGHCMALPTAAQRSRYEAVYAILEAGGIMESERRTYLPR